MIRGEYTEYKDRQLAHDSKLLECYHSFYNLDPA